jgi:hypothetical protein
MTMLPQLRESPETTKDQFAAVGALADAGCRAHPLVDNRHRQIAPTSSWAGLEKFTSPPLTGKIVAAARPET